MAPVKCQMNMFNSNTRLSFTFVTAVSAACRFKSSLNHNLMMPASTRSSWGLGALLKDTAANIVKGVGSRELHICQVKKKKGKRKMTDVSLEIVVCGEGAFWIASGHWKKGVESISHQV